MRRVVVPALMISLLLCGCGSGKSCSELVNDRRAKLGEAGAFAFTAEVTADLGDEEFSCVLRCENAPEGVSVSVLKPKELAGVEALISPDGETADFDGVTLCLPVGESGVPPLSAMAYIADALTSAHLTEAYRLSGADKEYIAAETYLGETQSITVLYAMPELTPECAELVSGGSAVIRCSLSDFSQQE